MNLLIRPLDPHKDLNNLQALYERAADYWLLADGRAPDRGKAAAFFTDGPPVCDPARSHRLGIFRGMRLVGVAEMSFGFPEPLDGYLGLMILDPAVRGEGIGPAVLHEMERLARAAGARRLYLGVLEANPRGRAFWARQGFVQTGINRLDQDSGNRLHRLGKDL